MLVWPEIVVIVGALLKALTFQVKEVCAFLVGEPLSVTMTVMLYGLATAALSEIVPKIRPDALFMDNPEGNPEAL